MITWFGWLTKGKCDVTGLDGLIFFGELVACVMVFSTLAYLLRKKN